MQLDAVEAGLARSFRRGCEVCDDRWNFVGGQLPRRRKIDVAVWKLELAFCRKGRGRHRQVAAPHIRVRDATAMPKLADNVTAGPMDRAVTPAIP